MDMANKPSALKPGDTVIIAGKHPWNSERGTLVVFEQYALGWHGWRVALDSGAECYADPGNLRRV
jgi:hypothetical protein